jgi:hypothetical protein
MHGVWLCSPVPSLAPFAGASLTELADALTSSMVVVLEDVQEGGSLARSGDGRERNGAGARFSVFSTPICKQCTSSQSIRWRPGRQVDICGVYAQVSSPNVIALVPFWTGLPIARPTASTAGVSRICAAIRWERVLAAAAPVRHGGG